MKNVAFLPFVVGMLFLSSCATIFCGSKKRIVLDSNIPEAKTVTVDGFKYHNVTFPFSVKVRRGFDETLITSKAEGYEPETLIIYKSFNGVSALNLLNILGWAIDAATGAIKKPEYKFYELEFIPKKKSDSGIYN